MDAEKQLYVAPHSNPDNSADKQREYVAKLAEMDDGALRIECERIIWLSAFTGNNPRSCYHWQADACYDECHRRGREGIYSSAHAAIVRQNRG